MHNAALGTLWLVGIAALGCGPASGKIAPASSSAASAIAIVATVPDLASLAREVGGERVAVECLVPGEGDPHDFEVRASDARRVADARLILSVGHGTEAGWLPQLLDVAKNTWVASDGLLDLGDGADAMAWRRR